MPPNIWKVDDKKFYIQMFKDYNKTKENLDEYINIMRDWSKTQLHFPEVTDDNVLRMVMLLSKFSIEKAKEKVDMYFTIRSLMPEFFSNSPCSSEMMFHSKIMYVVPLPKTTPDFKRVIYIRFNSKFGPEFFIEDKMLANCTNVIELMITMDKCYNFIFIMDYNGMQLGHLLRLNPLNYRKFFKIFEKVFSIRITCIYLVNVPKYMETFINTVIKPALHPKVRSRVQVLTGTYMLLEEFGKSMMPKDIGGEEKSLDELTDLILDSYKAQKDHFEVLLTLQVDESLRPEKLLNDDILGYYGNFKQLNID